MFKTVKEIIDGLEKKEFSSVELTQAYLARIKKIDHQLNSFVTVCAEQALQQAKAADTLRQKGGDIPTLTGVPIAQKDIFCTKDIKTTCGSRMLEDFIPPYNAHIIEKFNQSNAVMLGKTNMDEFAMGSSNETSYFGPVRNPWDLEYVPGGSSGGSAAAVAAGLAPASTGTDTGGSIRQPASLCNLVGLKPTYGRVSRYGMIAFASSLDQAGIFSRTAEDAAILLNIMAGLDKNDSTSMDVPVEDYTKNLNNSIEGLTIGLPKEFFDEKLDSQLGKSLELAIKELGKLGAKFKEVSLKNVHLAAPTYYIVAPAECSSNLSRFDGIRFGHRASEYNSLDEMYIKSRSEGFGDEVKRRILIGTYTLSSGYFDAYYTKAQKVRNLISQDFQTCFKEVDVILAPTSPGPAFKLNEKAKDPISMYLSDVYTIPTNLAGLTGINVPCGFINNLPVGMQLIGNYFKEGQLLNIAHKYQQITDWHLKHPEI